VVSAALRRSDALYRLGGEEFAALLPETTPTGALEAAARILAAVAGSPVAYEDAQVRITTSAGLACSDGGERDDIVAEADHALYQAKRGGRNRVFLPARRPVTHLPLAC
jgi:diguanylate cyclase (GGDEF)-like protein